MRRFAWIGVILLLSVVTYCTMSGVTTHTSQTGKTVQIMKEDTKFETAYTSRGPIFIYSDSDFSAYGFPGTGDENTPYLIEGYSITDSIYELIVIEDTEAYFVIQNNYLDSVTASLDAIYIRNAKNGRVHANIAVNNRHGIFLDVGCQGINVTHNVIEDSSESGIRVNSSSQIVVHYNEVSDNTYNGIWANFSTDLDIRNNTVYDDELGVWLENTNSSTVVGNAIYGNDNAIWISNHSSSNDISFNRIFDPQGLNPNTCGIHLSHNAHLNQILNNTVSNSTEHGFYVEATSGNNTIKWNSFIGNNVGGSSQAFDAYSINVLYNYWSDWTTPDDDFDQIVDI
ncbi:MAG: nitrous oxide reductase family maturation protein NosD, partial [Promethearchaeota archaeon]